VETTKHLAAAAGDIVAAEEWLEEFETGFALIAERFRRVEPRRAGPVVPARAAV
jgi:hypothetical protein